MLLLKGGMRDPRAIERSAEGAGWKWGYGAVSLEPLHVDHGVRTHLRDSV